MMLLASCQDVAEDTAQDQRAAESAVVNSGYPSLRTVPARPQLSYTVEQRRTIVDGLIADRENARYSSDVARYRTGLSGLPPRVPPVSRVESAPEVADAAAPSPPVETRDRPVVNPETEVVYEDDDLDSFMEEMVGEGPRPPASIGPESRAVPLRTDIVRATALRPTKPSSANDRRPPGAVWAIPAETTRSPAAPASQMRHRASRAVEVARGLQRSGPNALAGRAPGVVWGMVDMSTEPAAPHMADASVAPHPAPSAPRRPAPMRPVDRIASQGEATSATLAGRAPGVVWGMVDLPAEPTAPVAAPVATQTASVSVAPHPAPRAPRQRARATPVDATDGEKQSVEPTEIVLAGSPPPRPEFKPNGDTARIDVADGLVAIELAPGDPPAPGPDSVGFAPGSAALPPDAGARLERFLAAAKASDRPIRVVGEAAAPALALDRALAVGLVLVRSGVPANRLELTLASDWSDDRAQLFLAAPVP